MFSDHFTPHNCQGANLQQGKEAVTLLVQTRRQAGQISKKVLLVSVHDQSALGLVGVCKKQLTANHGSWNFAGTIWERAVDSKNMP